MISITEAVASTVSTMMAGKADHFRSRCHSMPISVAYTTVIAPASVGVKKP